MKRYLIAIITLSTLMACHSGPQPEEKAAATGKEGLIELSADQVKNAGIATAGLEKRRISTVIKVNGQIDVPPQNMVSISFPLGGFLKSTSLLPGMYVNKGSVIGVMEDQQFIQLQQDYLTSAARLEYLEKEFTRQRELNKTKATSDKLFEQTAAEFKSQRILNKSLAEKLQLIGINAARLNEDHISKSVNIYAPINGFVSKVNVNIGKFVNPADVLFEIVNPEDIHLALTVFEKDVNRLAIGQTVIAYTNTDPEKKYTCKIILIGKDLSSERSVQVHCHFERYDKSLIPGTFMNGEVETVADSSWSLPEDAVVRFENKEFVFCKRDARIFEMLPVKTGNHENGFVEIMVDGADNLLKKEFVTKGAYSLLMKVKNTEE
ncbi:MAG: efflux RND transporter periplasmic adaptor subunit [Chitinophaga sp.]|uniref:efflux RND transporter periplasmic adaptor subunit n=1 Tax=Chitinophaga sp. TaxID=1869181 RepID=UPI001B0B4655|nr:efflux RND transporter periplasmic adaptor subunit [Chitinophaga sp.]MBO9729608.1 efflux RND transporter periplasmic adaptor subunit [Chitinophaga sp.]